jgi:hypothetical protein
MVMKLISNPYQCGYSNIEENYREGICRHPKNADSICKSPDNFPTNCPLQDGIERYETFAQVLKVCKKICLEETGMSLIDKLTQPKRRNRVNCIHYGSGIMSTNRCHESERDISPIISSYRMVSPLCIGVNCGYYKEG